MLELMKIAKYAKFTLFGNERLKYRLNKLNLSTFGEPGPHSSS